MAVVVKGQETPMDPGKVILDRISMIYEINVKYNFCFSG